MKRVAASAHLQNLWHFEPANTQTIEPTFFSLPNAQTMEPTLDISPATELNLRVNLMDTTYVSMWVRPLPQ